MVRGYFDFGILRLITLPSEAAALQQDLSFVVLLKQIHV